MESAWRIKRLALFFFYPLHPFFVLGAHERSSSEMLPSDGREDGVDEVEESGDVSKYLTHKHQKKKNSILCGLILHKYETLWFRFKPSTGLFLAENIPVDWTVATVWGSAQWFSHLPWDEFLPQRKRRSCRSASVAGFVSWGWRRPTWRPHWGRRTPPTHDRQNPGHTHKRRSGNVLKARPLQCWVMMHLQGLTTAAQVELFLWQPKPKTIIHTSVMTKQKTETNITQPIGFCGRMWAEATRTHTRPPKTCRGRPAQGHRGG